MIRVKPFIEKNQGVFVNHYMYAPGGDKVQKAIFSVKVKVTSSDETIIADVAESIAETQPISINRIQNFESINR